MNTRVAIVGIAATKFRPASPDKSYRELTYEAAVKAYADAGVRFDEVQSFVSCTEDLIEGTSIADEYCPDQMGGAAKPVHTVSGNALFGVSSALLMIQAGLFDLVAVEAHSKASNVVNLEGVLLYGLDPFLERPLGISPDAIAALDLRRFLFEHKKTIEDVAWVVAKNRKAALQNEFAAFGGDVSLSEILQSSVIADPLHHAMKAPHADGALVAVLASEKRAKKMKQKPVWIEGMAWAGGPTDLSRTDWSRTEPLRQAAKKTYAMAGVLNPAQEITWAEVEDPYAHFELKFSEGLGLANGHEGINTSGGSLGMGDLLEAGGLARLHHLVLKLRKEKGGKGLAHGWQGLGTQSHAVCVLGNS